MTLYGVNVQVNGVDKGSFVENFDEDPKTGQFFSVNSPDRKIADGIYKVSTVSIITRTVIFNLVKPF